MAVTSLLVLHLLCAWGLGRFDRSRNEGGLGYGAMHLGISCFVLLFGGLSLLRGGSFVFASALIFAVIPASVLAYRIGLRSSFHDLFGLSAVGKENRTDR